MVYAIDQKYTLYMRTIALGAIYTAVMLAMQLMVYCSFRNRLFNCGKNVRKHNTRHRVFVYTRNIYIKYINR